MSRIAGLLLIFLPFFLSCKKEEKQKADAATTAEQGTYFSVRQYAKDHFDMYWGEPFTFSRIEVVDGEKDSVFVNTMNMNWKEVLKPFFASDIGDPKFLGQYEFSMLTDDATVSKMYYYEAKNDKLLTRKLQVTVDQFTNKVKSIYVETRDGEREQKLFYSPLKVIQIQEYRPAFVGKGKNVRIEYRFMSYISVDE